MTEATFGERVMILGATTPLGRAVTRQLLDAGTTRVLGVGAPHEEHGRFLHSPDVTKHRCDLARSRSVRELLFGPARDLEIDTVVDLAFHRSTARRGARAYALNVESTRQVMALAERHPTIGRYVLRSFADVYRVDPRLPTMIDEAHPLNLEPRRPQWLRDRVEADIVACMQIGTSKLRVAVLRCAECFAPGAGGQLWDYLRSRVCFRPLGFDPILNLASVGDLAEALRLAVRSDVQGIYNIPGADTLPLSAVIRHVGRRDIPVPDPALYPLYALRAVTTRRSFLYSLNRARFHHSCTLNGDKAAQELGYRPTRPIDWRPDASSPRRRASA